MMAGGRERSDWVRNLHRARRPSGCRSASTSWDAAARIVEAGHRRGRAGPPAAARQVRERVGRPRVVGRASGVAGRARDHRAPASDGWRRLGVLALEHVREQLAPKSEATATSDGSASTPLSHCSRSTSPPRSSGTMPPKNTPSSSWTASGSAAVAGFVERQVDVHEVAAGARLVGERRGRGRRRCPRPAGRRPPCASLWSDVLRDRELGRARERRRLHRADERAVEPVVRRRPPRRSRRCHGGGWTTRRGAGFVVEPEQRDGLPATLRVLLDRGVRDLRRDVAEQEPGLVRAEREVRGLAVRVRGGRLAVHAEQARGRCTTRRGRA